MFTNDFEIGDIIYRILSSVKIKNLYNPRFKKFNIKLNRPDICQKFIPIPQTPKKYYINNKEKKKILSYFTHYPNGNLDNSLLYYPLIWNRIEECLKRVNDVSLYIHPLFLTILDFQQNQADVFYTPKIKKTFENLVFTPVIFAHFLNSFYATMIHCCGVIINNKSVIFLAPDEGGKTKLARIYEGYHVLSDDQVIIRKKGKNFIAYSTPWGSIINNSKKAKVGAFFLLEKANYFMISSLKPEKILDYLWNGHFSYRIFLPKKLKTKNFQLLCDLAYSIPAYRLKFPKDYIDKKAIEAAISK